MTFQSLPTRTAVAQMRASHCVKLVFFTLCPLRFSPSTSLLARDFWRQPREHRRVKLLYSMFSGMSDSMNSLSRTKPDFALDASIFLFQHVSLERELFFTAMREKYVPVGRGC
jgi:hypothetical protein